MSRVKTAKSVRSYYSNAIKKNSTEGHTTIKSLLYEEINKIPGWEIDKCGKKLIKNVSAYVKRRHPYIYNTSFLEKGEEESAGKTIREYLNHYIFEKDSDYSGSEDRTSGTKMTLEDQDEELGALIAIDENELDYMSLHNLIKFKVDNPSIIDSISTDFDEVIERLSKLEQKLSIEKYMRSYIAGLQRLKFLFKNTVPTVGDRKIHIVENDDLFDKIDDASCDLMEEYVDKVPLSFACPGTVDKKDYIIATVNLPKGTPVYSLPAKYKNYPVLIDYGIMRASTNPNKCREYHHDLKPGISIGDSGLDDTFTLGAFFITSEQPDKNYLLTVNHGVGEGNLHCATVTKYKDSSVDESGCLLDFAFCEVDKIRGIFANNKPCESDIGIAEIHSTLDHTVGSIISVQKVGRTTGHSIGKMKNKMKRVLVTGMFEKETYAKMLVVTGYFGAHGDSGAPVYDQDGLWGIYQSTSDSGYSSCVVPIDLIIGSIYEKEHVEFDLFVKGHNLPTGSERTNDEIEDEEMCE